MISQPVVSPLSVFLAEIFPAKELWIVSFEVSLSDSNQDDWICSIFDSIAWFLEFRILTSSMKPQMESSNFSKKLLLSNGCKFSCNELDANEVSSEYYKKKKYAYIVIIR